VDQPLASAALPADPPAVAGSGGAAENGHGSIKTTLVNLLPPATLAAVILFWGLAPQAVIEHPWTLVAVGLALLAWVQALEWFFERHEGWRLNKREFATDLFYVVLTYTAIGWAARTLGDAPLLALKESLGISTPWLTQLPFLLQALLAFSIFEFGQYWMHRAMHNWRPLWLTHAPHHHITQLNALKGWVGNPIELFLISLSVLALLDFDTAALFCAVNMGGAISAFAHGNVRSDPPLFYSFVFTTIRHHSLHHTALSYEDTRCNYGNSLILLDRLFGTYREGESSVVGQDERKRLSIYEQFMFPFQPLIDGIKARRGKSAPAPS
jgi:sterol desaturase/sphingolipid hydroxylase (fatty acid hydroxylase superfamily)